MNKNRMKVLICLFLLTGLLIVFITYLVQVGGYGSPEAPEQGDRDGGSSETQLAGQRSIYGWTVPNVWGNGPSGLPVVPIRANENGTLIMKNEVPNPVQPSPPETTINASTWVRMGRFDPIPEKTSFGNNSPKLLYLNVSKIGGNIDQGARSEYPSSGREGDPISPSHLSEAGDYAWARISTDPGGPPNGGDNPLPILVLRLDDSDVTNLHTPFVANRSLLAFVGLGPSSGVLAVGPDWPFNESPNLDGKTNRDLGPYPVSGEDGFSVWDPRSVTGDLIALPEENPGTE